MRLLLVFLFLFSSFGAHAKTMIVGVSPYWGQEAHSEHFIAFMKFGTSLDVGDKLIFIDAFSLNEIGEFIVPEQKAYRHPKAILNKNGATVGKLKALHANPKGVTRVNGAIRLPHFLRHVADYYGDIDSKTVLLLGSAFFDDVREPTYSMLNGVFPSDAHIALPFHESIFGTKNARDLLSGWQIHLAYGDSAMINSRHHHFVKRFWTLYVESLGAKLETFDPSLPRTLKRAWESKTALDNDYELMSGQEREMLKLRISDSQIPIHRRRLSSVTLSDDQIRNAKNVEISAIWGCDCDVDVHAKPNPYADVISFKKPLTSHGWFFKDQTTQSPNQKVYETIEFYRDIDLTATQIALVLYRGDAPNGVSGSIRIAIDGETYAAPFTINATQGQATNDLTSVFADNKSSAPHILLIAPINVVSQNL